MTARTWADQYGGGTWVKYRRKLHLRGGAPFAVAQVEAFDRIEGKAEFTALCDELGRPQPQSWHCDQWPAPVPYPHWVKVPGGTARAVGRRVDSAARERQAVYELPRGRWPGPSARRPHDRGQGWPVKPRNGHARRLFSDTLRHHSP